MPWLSVVDEGPIRWLTIDRPGRKNAIPFDGWPLLTEELNRFEVSDSRVMIVTGGGADFCAGADLSPDDREEMSSVAARHERMKVVGAAASALQRSTKPTIAAVDGVAVGAGMNLALACDVVVASERARFSEIFVRRGLSIDFGGTWILPRVVGLQRAKELALSGRIVEAQEAVSIGLALEVVPVDQLHDRARRIADSFLDGAPVAQMLIKRALNASFETSFADAVYWEGQSQAVAWGTQDAAEGISAFVEKRRPEWTGR